MKNSLLANFFDVHVILLKAAGLLDKFLVTLKLIKNPVLIGINLNFLHSKRICTCTFICIRKKIDFSNLYFW